MTGVWIDLAIVVGLGFAALVLFAIASCPSVDESKRAEVEDVRARAVRANHERDRTTFAQRRAIADGIQKMKRDHHL